MVHDIEKLTFLVSVNNLENHVYKILYNTAFKRLLSYKVKTIWKHWYLNLRSSKENEPLKHI